MCCGLHGCLAGGAFGGGFGQPGGAFGGGSQPNQPGGAFAGLALTPSCACYAPVTFNGSLACFAGIC